MALGISKGAKPFSEGFMYSHDLVVLCEYHILKWLNGLYGLVNSSGPSDTYMRQ